MSNEWNVVYVDMEVNLDPFEKWLNQWLKLARDTWKVLNQELLLKLEMDYSELKVAKFEAQQALNSIRRWYKEWLIDRSKLIEAENWFKRISSASTEAWRKLENYKNIWDSSISRLQKKFDGLWSKISSLNPLIAKVWVAITTYLSVDKVKQLSDSFTNLDNRLKQVAQWEQLDNLREKIFKAADEARVSVEDYASAFVRFDLVNKQLWWSQNETLLIMDSLSKWLSASWAAASEVNSVMLQLSQAFWSWVLQWDEFRSLAENMPILLDILAEKLWVARWELKELAANWEITSKVLKEALIEANEKLNDSFDKTSVTIGQAMTQATNKFIKKYWEMDESYNMTNKITKAIWLLWDWVIWLFEKWVEATTGLNFYFAYLANKSIKAFIEIKWWLKLLWEYFISTYDFIAQNSLILWENIWIAFWNIPALAKEWLNSFLELLNGTINESINLLNKIPNVNIKPVDFTIQGWWDVEEFKAFQKFNTDKIDALKERIETEKKIQDDALIATALRLDKEKKIYNWWDLRGGTSWNNNTWINNKWNDNKALKKKLEDEAKIKEEALKKELEMEKRFEDRLNKTRIQRVENLEEQYDRLSDSFDDSIDKIKDKKEDLDDTLKKSADTITGLTEDLKKLESWKTWDLSDRFISAKEEILKLQDEIKKAEQEWISAKFANNLWEKNLKDIW